MKFLKQLCMLVVLALFASFTLQAQSDATVQVTAPAGVAGDYGAFQAGFGPGITMDVSGPVVEGVDTASLTTVCDTVANDLTGAIALVDRGACAFVNKVFNAQTKGAMAVIVCNNDTASPNKAQSMGGDDMGTLTIPSVMLSYNSCQTIRAELGNGLTATLTGTGITPGPGEGCNDPAVIGAGVHTVDSIGAGLGAIEANAGNAVWYSYAPTSDILVTVSSCALTTEDTRLYVYTGPDCDPANLTTVATNDDCDPDNNVFSSEASFIGSGGTEYLIYWDDRWSDEGFDFEVIENALPNVAVTFTVDMSQETVDAGNPPKIAGTFNGLAQEDLTDNMDGTWSGTYTLTAGDMIQYRFLNGTDVWETSADLIDCGVDDGAGNIVRTYTVGLDDVQTLSTVCFNMCGSCPAADCSTPTVIIDDNLDSYTAGDPVDGQAAHWAPWPGAVASLVSTEQAASGANSLKVDGNNATEDVLLLFGDLATGHYKIDYKIYVPAGNGAYSNIQKTEATGEWAYNLYFNNDGTGNIDAGVANAATFTYTQDDWVDVIQYVDVDNDRITLYVDNSFVFEWPFSWQAGQMSGLLSLGAINFWPQDATNVFYIDDVYFAQIPTAGSNFYCSLATPISVGMNTAGTAECFGGPDQENAPSATWYSYTADADGYAFLSSCGMGLDTRVWIFSECGDRKTLGVNDDECDLGNGSIWASYREWPVTAGTTYYIAWDNRWDNDVFDFELGFFTDEFAGDFCQLAIPVSFGTHTISSWGWAAVSGPQIGAVGGYTPYSNSKWYAFTPDADATVRAHSCDVASTDTRVWIYTGDCTYFETLNLVASSDDDCALQSDITWDVTAGTTYYIEWDDVGSGNEPVHDWELEEIVPMPVSVTFNLDMNFITPQNGGFISINSGAGIAMTDNGDMTFTHTEMILPGTVVEYRFQNGLGNSETVPTTCANDNGNREVTVADLDIDIPIVCFATCDAMCVVGVSEAAFAQALNLFPNPARHTSELTFNFSETLDLDITVSNMVGKRMYHTNLQGVQSGTHSIDLNNYAPGVYLVRMTDGVNNLTKRLVVQ